MTKGSLKISQDVVDSFTTNGGRAVSMLSTSTHFAESMAAAAGPNGPLRETLKSAEGSWRIRREKIKEILENLVQNVSDINEGFAAIDDELASALSDSSSTPGGADTGASAGAQPGVEARDGSSQSSLPPLGGGSTGAATGGGNSGGAAFPTMPMTSGDAPSGALPTTVQEGQRPQSLVDMESITRPPVDTKTLIAEFSQQWASLTGRPIEEIVALLAAGGGIASLLTALSGGAKSAGGGGDGADEAPLGGGSFDSTGDDRNGGAAGSGDSSAEATVPDDASGVGDGPVGEANPSPEEPTSDDGVADSEAPTNGIGTPGDESLPDLEAAPIAPEDPVRGEVPAELAEALVPGDPITPEALVDWPSLEPSVAESVAGGAGAAGGEPFELPPLTVSEAGADVASGDGASGTLSLPDLTESAGEIVGQASSADLPNLRTESRSVGAMPVGAMGGGAMGGGSPAQGTTVPAATTTGSTEGATARRNAKDVLGDDERNSES